MPSTHSRLYCHIVFSTKYRVAGIRESWQERFHSYLGGTSRVLSACHAGKKICLTIHTYVSIIRMYE